jgi:octaprenyl-diphosphate synthase
MMVGIGSPRVMEIMADTTNTIAEGEVLQLLHCHDPDTSEERYQAVIYAKTAKLFEAAAQLGAVLAGRPRAEEQALARYGRHLGTAFQLIDDVLDYRASRAELGKNIGDDLAEGKPTLPLIIAQRRASSEQVEFIRAAIRDGDREALPLVIAAIRETDALDESIVRAREYAREACQELQVLPASAYRDALYDLADYAVARVS